MPFIAREVELNKEHFDRRRAVPHPLEADALIPAAVDISSTVRAVVAGLLRQRFVIAAITAAFVALGLAYAMTATPTFTSTASVLVDPRIPSSPTTGATAAPILLLSDQLVVDSEVKVLQSRELSARLLDRIKEIGRQPPPEGSIFDVVSEAVDAARNAVEGLTGGTRDVVVDSETALLRAREAERLALVRNLAIERSGETYVIDVAYSSTSPAFAATVVNTLVDEYFLLQAQAALENTRRLNDWLSARVANLAEEVAAADAAVDSYRLANNLFGVDDESVNSSVRNELAEANAQLITTRSELIDIDAQIDQLNNAIATDVVSVSVDPETSTTIGELRRSYFEKVDRARELAQQLGPDHALVLTARANTERARDLIVEELGNAAEALRVRRATFAAQAQTTQLRIDDLQRAIGEEDQKSIRLRQLQNGADAKRTLYQSLLQQLNDTAQKESFAPTPARIIARAVPADQKSAPNAKLVVVLAMFGGLVFGSAIAFLREELNDSLVRVDDVEHGLDLPLIGLAPLIGDDMRRLRRWGVKVPQGQHKALRFGRRPNQNLRFAADFPRSMRAETLRNLDARIAGDPNAPRRCVVVGLTSAKKGEGKSTLCANFAVMKADRGHRVAVLDLDVRALGFTGLARSVSKQNMLDGLLAGTSKLGDVVPSAHLSGVHVISPGRRDAVILSEPDTLRALARLIADMRTSFDYVIVDLPPLTGLVDAELAAQLTDQMVLVVEWGRTRLGQLKHLLSVNGRVRQSLVGAIYSKVRLKSYVDYNGRAIEDYYSY